MEKLWEDIIPEDERKKIEAEEDEQRLREMNLGPRERKQITDVSCEDKCLEIGISVIVPSFVRGVHVLFPLI